MIEAMDSRSFRTRHFAVWFVCLIFRGRRRGCPHRELAARTAAGIARLVSPGHGSHAIGDRPGLCSWEIDHASWVVTLHAREEQDVSGKTLEEALAWCLVWLMAPEIGGGSFLV